MIYTKHIKGIVLSFIVTQFLPLFIYAFLLILLNQINNNVLFSISIIVGSFIGFIIMLYVIRDELNEIKKQFVKKSIFYGLIGFILVMITQIILGTLIQVFTSMSFSTESEKMVFELTQINLLFFLFPAFIGPIQEEILFRYAILGTLMKRVKTIYAVLISSAAFALIHLSLINFIVYFVSGMIFSLIYIKSKSIFAPIIAHVLLNSYVVIAMFCY